MSIHTLARVHYRTVTKFLRLIGFYQSRNVQYARILTGLLGPLDGKTVVDVGCGPGMITCLIAAKRTIGLDQDLASLLRFVVPEFARIRGIASNLPFKVGTIDVVLAVSLVEHLRTPEPFFQESTRLLRPNGRLAMQLPEM